MHKKDLVKYVSDKTMIMQKDASIIVDVVMDGIKKALEDGDRVKIRDFGSFFIQERKARKAINPYNQTPVDVPAKKVIKFKPADILHKKVNI